MRSGAVEVEYRKLDHGEERRNENGGEDKEVAAAALAHASCQQNVNNSRPSQGGVSWESPRLC